jgi:predicted nucleotide-binding protein
VKLNPIILHEQANEGKTIIEKFEHHSDVSYAIALLTPDDSAFSKKSAETVNDRARQNVIFELGYFLGKLGRKNVCALIKSKVEIPSDYQGIVYIDYDEKNAWKFQIAKELRSAGFEIDMNDLI